MNFSAYFFLAAAVVLMIFCAQQSGAAAVEDTDCKKKQVCETIRIIKNSSKENEDASVFLNATIVVKDALIKLTKNVSKSEDMFLDEMSAAKKVILQDPEAAKKLLLKALKEIQVSIYNAGVPIFESLGIALALSNGGATQGLGVASGFIQEGGLQALDAWNYAEKLLNQGIDAGGKANMALLKSVGLAVQAGFSAAFINFQKTAQNANKALRDAKIKPLAIDPNCESASKDAAVSDAMKDINEAANNALKRGVNADLVRKINTTFLCSLSDLVNITIHAKRTFENVKKIAGVEPLAAKIIFFKQANGFKNKVYAVAAKIFLLLGEVALKTGKQSNSTIGTAILAIERGRAEICLGIQTAEDLIVFGLRYKGEAYKLAFEAAASSGLYAKIAFIDEAVNAAKLLYSVL